MSGGRGANRSGKIAEDAIADALARQQYDFRRQVVDGVSIYGKKIRADFLVRNVAAFPLGLIIEVKWQDRYGTADQKFPYLSLNIREGRYQHPVLAVIYGGGFHPGAVRWLQSQVDGTHLVAVVNFDGFLSWLQRCQRVA